MVGVEPENPPFAQLTPNNHGPIIIVSSYIFLALSFITVITRCGNRYRVLRKLAWDDWLIAICFFLAMAQSIALTVSVNNGLGRHREDLSDAEFLAQAKAFYVSDIFAIPTLTLAKISTLLLIVAIQPPRTIVTICKGLGVLTIVWAIALQFALAFRCSLPTPWNFEGKCGNLEALYIVQHVWNITTDIVLVILPIMMMRKVHVTSGKRWTVNALFGSRIIVPGFALASLISAHDAYAAGAPDMTWRLVTPSIWYQGMLNLSIITACIPCIKRFLADLSVGLTVIAVSEPLELTVKQGSSGNPSSGNRYDSSHSGPGFFSGLLSRSRAAHQSQEPAAASRKKSAVANNEDPYSKRQDFQPDWATRSRPVIERSESVKGLTQNIIVQTIDYEVNYERGPGSARHTSDRDSSSKSLQVRSQSAGS